MTKFNMGKIRWKLQKRFLTLQKQFFPAFFIKIIGNFNQRVVNKANNNTKKVNLRFCLAQFFYGCVAIVSNNAVHPL